VWHYRTILRSCWKTTSGFSNSRSVVRQVSHKSTWIAPLCFQQRKRGVLCFRGHSAKHGHHGTIPNTVSLVRIFIFPFLKTVSVHNAAGVGCHFVTKLHFGQIGLIVPRSSVIEQKCLYLRTFSFGIVLYNSSSF
jgi:hypothetical protein